MGRSNRLAADLVNRLPVRGRSSTIEVVLQKLNSASIIIIAFVALIKVYSAEPDTPLWNLPSDLQAAIKKPSFHGLTAGTWINPLYLRGDFDGDGKPDYALLVTSTLDNKKGIAIWLSSRRGTPIVIGAGRNAKAAGLEEDNWNFFDAWEVYGKRSVGRGVGEGPPPRLIGEAILIERTEAASGLLYWAGQSFRWYQQSD